MVLALIFGAVAFLAVGLQIGGAGAPRELLDPGPVVRYLMPLSRTLVNLSVGVVLGALALCVWALSTARDEYRRALDIAAGAAAVLTVASVMALITTFVDASGLPFSAGADFGRALAQFATEIELGRLWLIEVGLAAVLAVVCFAIRERRLTLVPLTVAVLALFPLAAQGHAAGASGHSLALNAMFLHLLGAGVWLGGLVTIALLSPHVDPERRAIVTERYSLLALLGFAAVAASGLVSGAMRLTEPSDLVTTGYGQLLLGKTVVLVLLGALGAVQRVRLIPRISRPGAPGRRAFAWVVAIEITLMGVASGLAGALGRTQTPVPIEVARESYADPTPAEWLTGEPLPPELTGARVFTEWKFELLWAFISTVAIVAYLAGVWVLRRRGDRWPVGRTVAWIAGLLLLVWTTNGFLNAYESYLFSIHMLGHMLLTMGIPMLLVLGGPVTLALRVSRKRRDGSWGVREWILWAVDTPWSKFVTNPVVAAVIFAGSLWVFYFTPVLRWAMESHLGHQWMIIHFLISGYLFTLSMIGVDPVPRRFPFPLRLVTLFATMAVHAFFGVTVMTGTGLLAADWFGSMGRTWGDPPLMDQQSGGGIAWGIGEIPTLLLTLVVALQWARSDEREQRRTDRAADRLGDQELEAYNQMLQQRAARHLPREPHV